MVFSCKEAEETNLISFTNAQPEGKSNLKEFPSKIFGIYRNYDTQEELTINKNTIISTKFVTDTFPSRLKDSLKDEKLFNSNYRFNKFETLKNDSILVTYEVIDTIFDIKKNILKKFKGHYFLNYKRDSLEWNVKKLSFNKNILNLNSIETKNEIKIMEAVMALKSSDSISKLVVKPTKKQFKEFINKSGFKNGDSYLKIE